MFLFPSFKWIHFKIKLIYFYFNFKTKQTKFNTKCCSVRRELTSNDLLAVLNTNATWKK